MIIFDISPEFSKLNLNNVKIGYTMAQAVVNHPRFYSELLKTKKVTYTKQTVIEVWENCLIVQKRDTVIPVKPYFYKNADVIGMTSGDGAIYVNTNGAQKRVTGDYLGNGLHELSHYPFGYGHGSNFPNGWRARLMGDFADKNFSVPYIFEKIGKTLYKEIL